MWCLSERKHQKQEELLTEAERCRKWFEFYCWVVVHTTVGVNVSVNGCLSLHVDMSRPICGQLLLS